MSRLAAVVAGAALAAGCYEGALPPRTPLVDASFAVPAEGVSEVITFEVPDDVRSLTVEIRGDPNGLFALSSLVLADGIDRIDLGVTGTVFERLEQIYTTAPLLKTGSVQQLVRRGTFTLLYPETYQQAPPAGPATLRVAASVSGSVHVKVVAPRDDGADVLHVNVVSVSATPDTSRPAWLDDAQTIFDQAGIRLALDGTYRMSPEGFEAIVPTWLPEPGDAAAQLAIAGHDVTESDGVTLFMVEPFDRQAFTLGIPGPLDPDSYYAGVVVSSSIEWPDDQEKVMGRVVAHELAHYLGLPHTEEFLPSGEELPDPFDDTFSDEPNLMGSVDQGAPLVPADTSLSERQIYRLERSALLETD